MKKHFLIITNVLFALLLATVCLTANANTPNAIELTSIVELEVVILDEQGKEIVKRIPAEKVTPGSEVIYTTRFKYNGTEPAENIVISNPIPEHTVYKLGSAKGQKTAVVYSVDGGKSFHEKNQLTIKESNGSERFAQATDYTDVQWTYRGQLQQGDEGSVEFRVVLK